MAKKDTNSFVATQIIAPSRAPVTQSGFIGWVRSNLLATPWDALFTVIAVALLVYHGSNFFQWAVVDAVFFADNLKACRAINPDGACWAVVYHRFYQFIFGFYPADAYWRPILAFILLLVALVPILYDKTPYRFYGLCYALVYPVIAWWLIWGGWGLEFVESDKIGGALLALIIGVTGILGSLPLGILLALGRRSKLVFIKSVSVGFIEFIRGVPLITLLFIASTLLSYFLPPGTTFDLILRVVIMVTLFASAYMAEVIRGGLAALPQGQYEAAEAMGLNYFQVMRLIILPQALKITIPGIVNTFIGLFKDTTLVLIIGMYDPLGIIRPILAHTDWNGLVWEPYLFVALFFFIFCFGMSRYSIYLERKLETDKR